MPARSVASRTPGALRSLAIALLAGAALTSTPRPAAADGPPAVATVASPDGRTVVSVSLDATGAPTYTVRRDGRLLIAPSVLGLKLVGGERLADGFAVARADATAGHDRYRLVAGKTSQVDDAYHALNVSLVQPGGAHRRLQIELRAYDSGVAFRYRVPAQPGLPTLALASELTQFAFPQDYGCWGLNLGQYENSHEGEFDPIPASRIRSHDLYDAPLVCQTGGTTLALTESNLKDWSGAWFSGRSDGQLGVEVTLTPRWRDPDVAVRRPIGPDGAASPWRVILLGDTASSLIESTLVTDLAEPEAVADTGWIKPGKAAWDWWSDRLAPGVAHPGSNTETLKAYIDFAGRFGLPYMIVDQGWYLNGGTDATIPPGADITRDAPDVDLPALIAYGAQRHVGLFVWVNWKLIDARMEEALSLYERWGLKGIKVDFINRQDQQAVDFYHRLLAAAARHHLLVDLHGAYAPRGLIRTYPNFLTQEGVMGAEYNKWSVRVTATHNLTLPFTRGLLGPMDYTPGGFRNVTPAQFEPRNTAPEVMTTRGQQLAMYVVYDSPLAVLADAPSAYEGQAGADFLKLVPPTWDETRALSGEIGRYVAVARRSGKDWYVGAMTNEEGRPLSLPLGFLHGGRWRVTTWSDGVAPTALSVSTTELDAAHGPLMLTLAPSGGAVVRFTPLP